MNYRIVGIAVAIIVMLFSPTVAGLIMDGQALNEQNNEELDKNDLEKKEIELYVTSTGVKNELDFEEYICCVLLCEVPASFEPEALKAMAVAVRSYCLRRLDSDEKYTSHFSADVCDDYTHCLGYISLEDAKTRWGENRALEYYKIIKDAVSQTEGEILYYDGNVIDAVFHSNSSAYTESAVNVWGFDVPYLVSVSTPEAPTESFNEYTSDEFKQILNNEGIICDFSEDCSEWLQDTKKTENGRVESVSLCDTVITGRRVREIFGLRSTCFDISFFEGVYKFEVYGEGHGVGMSQYGCNELAIDGMDYRQILAHYYPLTELGLY